MGQAKGFGGGQYLLLDWDGWTEWTGTWGHMALVRSAIDIGNVK